MRIVHLSTSDTGGGAARAAYRLHTGLLRLGHESSMLVWRRLSNDPAVRGFLPRKDWIARLKHKLRARRIRHDHRRYAASIPSGFEPFSDDRTEFAGELPAQIPACDIINLHWVAGLVDYEHFFTRLPAGVPVVWRLADMGPLTGGCHYDHHCGRFAARCGTCPQLGSSDQQDLSRQIWQRKAAALHGLAPGSLHLVGTSNWIAEQARRSSLLSQFPISIIPNGLDTDDFSPRDKTFARDLWNIPRDARVVLFAAESIANRRKGLSYLAEAVKAIRDMPRLLLVSVGGGKLELDHSIPHLPLGRINHDRTLSTIYSAADLYVIPSLQESFGQTVIESLACGTPVIGFDTGGIPDMVRPGRTGWLVGVGDTAALGETVRIALSDPDLRAQFALNCRRTALDEYASEVQARAYVRLYETLQLKTPAAAQDPASAAQVLTPPDRGVRRNFGQAAGKPAQAGRGSDRLE